MPTLADGDVVVVTSKIVSKAEGCTVELAASTPSAFATEWATKWDKDPRLVEVVLSESARIVRQVGRSADHRDPPRLRVRQHRRRPVVERRRRPSVGAAVGIPMHRRAACAPARRARRVDVAVIVTDTFGRPWREGQTDVAIGVAGIEPIRQLRRPARSPRPRVQGAGDLRRRRARQRRRTGQGQHSAGCRSPIIRGYAWEPTTTHRWRPSSVTRSRDLFR